MLAALPSFAAIAGLSGYALVAVVSVLLVVEEVGIPLFFAPGDLMLAVSGAVISTGHLNPLLVVAATTSSVLVGALAGRELFARLGYPAAARIAGFLHVRGGLDRLAARVRRGGAAAVFVGRITPGLRVHTTEAAGLVRMRRTTFLAGLLPAVALYEAIFIGLGVWQGQAAWSIVQAYSPNPAVVFALLIAAVGSLLVGRLLICGLRRRRLDDTLQRRYDDVRRLGSTDPQVQMDDTPRVDPPARLRRRRAAGGGCAGLQRLAVLWDGVRSRGQPDQHTATGDRSSDVRPDLLERVAADE